MKDIAHCIVEARLHQASASMLRQLCNNTSNTVLIEKQWSCSRLGLQPIFE